MATVIAKLVAPVRSGWPATVGRLYGCPRCRMTYGVARGETFRCGDRAPRTLETSPSEDEHERGFRRQRERSVRGPATDTDMAWGEGEQ